MYPDKRRRTRAFYPRIGQYVPGQNLFDEPEMYDGCQNEPECKSTKTEYTDVLERAMPGDLVSTKNDFNMAAAFIAFFSVEKPKKVD